LKVAKGEFIAIFDADFLPSADFLEKTVPYFGDDRIAMVQARWGHINQDYSLLTKIQSILLDRPIVLEPPAHGIAPECFQLQRLRRICAGTAITDAGAGSTTR
jgi:hypothetical protein